MFADVMRLLNGDIRELAWIMLRESAKTSIAKAVIVYLNHAIFYWLVRSSADPHKCSLMRAV